MGKKLVSTINVTLGSNPYPSHKTKRGAMATVGTVCVSIIRGYADFSNKLNLSISTAITKPNAAPIVSPSNASVNVVLACPINKEKSFINAAATSKGEGSINFGTRPADDTNCQTASIKTIAIREDVLLMMLCNFFFNSKHPALRSQRDFYISRYLGSPGL